MDKWTWGQIKYAALQKMFSITGSATTIPTDSSTMEYINAMPQAANEALQLLSTAGKFIIKEYQYLNYPVDNLLSGDTFRSYRIVNDSTTFEAEGALSYYFKIKGKPTLCKLYVGDHEVKDFYPFDNEIDTKQFTTFKGNITYPTLVEGEDDTVKLIVEAYTPVDLVNVCFYDCPFETDEEVPPYEKYIRIKMDDVLNDFYQLAPAELYDLGVSGNEYIVANEYFQEADKTLVIPRDKAGIYVIHYRAYPQQITLATPDDTELALDPEVAVLIPLYICSQVYKDDDASIAVQARNEFEIAREALSQGALVPKKEKFVPSSGWC